MAAEPILSETRSWRATRTEQPTRLGPECISAISLDIVAAISIEYGFHRTARCSGFATSSSTRTRSLTQTRNPCVNTVCGSIEKTLVELNLFQTLTNRKIQTQTLKSGLSSL